MSLSSVALLSFLALLQVSHAQDASISSITTKTVTTDAPTLVSSTQTISRITQSSTASLTTTPTKPATPDVFPNSSSSSEEPVHDASVFNYYFLFLAVFGVFLAALLWWLRLRRRRQKQQQRLNGQQALARDFEGWAGARRFMHGRYGRHAASVQVRREDGLDEDGEAPPPYYPKSDTGRDPESGLAIPLRAVPSGGNQQVELPGYTVRANGF
jgi:hypothetical protein